MDLWDNLDQSKTYNTLYNHTTRPLTKENNLLLAKQYMVDTIYRMANIEGLGMTFPETQTICDGMSVEGKSIDDINTVADLKHAMQWIFAHADAPINLDTLKIINRLVGKYTVINAGSLRTRYDEPIRVPIHHGEYYYPSLPSDSQITNLIQNIFRDYEGMGIALELFCQIAKSQVFNNGNKRTATIFANLYMMQHGLGILSIPNTKKHEFYQLLIDYYETDDKKQPLKTFLFDYCITGNGRVSG